MTERPGEGSDPLLSVSDLETHYPITEGWLRREVGREPGADEPRPAGDQQATSC